MLMLFLSVFASLVSLSSAVSPFIVQDASLSLDNVKVPVHLGVQSRDRDAQLCENIFDAVLKRVVLRNKIDMQLVYVAELDESEPDFGVVCPNGRMECAGNVHQLCAAKYADTFAHFWEFIHCSNYQGLDKVGNPETAQKCARSANLKAEWNDCIVHPEEGVQLLRESVKLAKTLDIERSCTILINESPVCIRDGTWKECENGHTANDFVRQILNEYERIN